MPSDNPIRATLLLQMQISTSKKNQYDSMDIPNWNLMYYIKIFHYYKMNI